MPLELFALASGSEAYLSAVEIVGRRDLERLASPDEFTMPRRTHAAVVAAGGIAADTAWRFPLPRAGSARIDRIDARSLERSSTTAVRRAMLEEHLVRRIRQWRPEVIVTEDVSPRGENPLAHLTNQVTLAAVAKAADAKAYSAAKSGRRPRAVEGEKGLHAATSERQAVVNITPAQWSPRLGRSLADMAESGRALLAGRRYSLAADHRPGPACRSPAAGDRPPRHHERHRRSAPAARPAGKLSQPPPGDLEAAQPTGPEAAQRRAAPGPHR